MAKRQPGRPRYEFEALDAALAASGGVRRVLLELRESGLTWRQIADRLAELGGVRIARATAHYWHQQVAMEDRVRRELERRVSETLG